MLNSYSEDSSFLSSLMKLLSCYRSNFKTLMRLQCLKRSFEQNKRSEGLFQVIQKDEKSILFKTFSVVSIQ